MAPKRNCVICFYQDVDIFTTSSLADVCMLLTSLDDAWSNNSNAQRDFIDMMDSISSNTFHVVLELSVALTQNVLLSSVY